MFPTVDSGRAKSWITDWRRGNSPQQQSTHRFIDQRNFLLTQNRERFIRARHHRSIDSSRARLSRPGNVRRIESGSVRACGCHFAKSRRWPRWSHCFTESSAEGIRPIEALVGDRPALSEKLVELARWMSAYYCCPIEAVMRSLLPQVIRRAEVGWKKQLFVERREGDFRGGDREIAAARAAPGRITRGRCEASALRFSPPNFSARRRSITRRCAPWRNVDSCRCAKRPSRAIPTRMSNSSRPAVSP